MKSYAYQHMYGVVQKCSAASCTTNCTDYHADEASYRPLSAPTDTQSEVVEGVFVNLFQFALHLHGEVDERCEMHLALTTLAMETWTIMNAQSYEIVLTLFSIILFSFISRMPNIPVSLKIRVYFSFVN